jgi:putative transposase
MRWHAHYHTAGTGHLYQGRFKSFPVATDDHLYAVLRHVERNALRAGLVTRAERWRWGSLWRRCAGEAGKPALLTAWPVPEPENWVALVNRPQSEAELAAVRQAVARGSPYEPAAWQQLTGPVGWAWSSRCGRAGG